MKLIRAEGETDWACLRHGKLSAAANICPHCAEDAKILEERIGAVAAAIVGPAPGTGDDWTVATHQRQIVTALRDLVREIRRS